MLDFAYRHPELADDDMRLKLPLEFEQALEKQGLNVNSFMSKTLVLPRFTFGDGNLEVAIETSTNLTQWAPHYVFRTSNIGTHFFRLTIRQKR